MDYLDPVDSTTLKKIGVNMAILVGVALTLAVLASFLV